MQSSRRGTDRANTRLFSRDPLPPVRTKKRHVLRLEPLEERTLLSTYNIGPGQPYTTLGSFPWSNLGPGDTVDIHWQSTPYREKLMISESGTASQPINIVGVPGPNGQQPIIDGQNATTSSQFHYSYDPMQEDSLICIYHSADQPGSYTPSYINISGLELEGAYSGTNDGGPYTFTDSHGTVQDYADFAAAIYANGVQNLTIQNCTIHNNGLGIFVNSNTDNGANLSSNILIQSNSIYGNGVVGQFLEHNTYIEAAGVTYQYNDYGPLRPGAGGSQLKDRSAGTVIRYNYFAPGGHILDLVEAEDSAIIAALPSYKNIYVYGNILNNNAGSNASTFPVHFGYDNSWDRARPYLYYYDNIFINVTNNWRTMIFEMPTNVQTVYAQNNIFYNSGGSILEFAQNAGNFVFSATNWVSPGWLPSEAVELQQAYGGALNYSGTITGTNTFFTDSNNNPGFVNLSGGDYHLGGSSNAIGKGGSLGSGWPTVDYQYVAPTSGTSRTSIADLGAYQAGAVTPPVSAATQLNVSVPNPPAAAGVPFNLTVTAQNASNGTATGYTGTVHFSSSDSQVAGLPANYTFTAADAGVHTFTGLILKTAGSQTVTATDTVTSSITGSATVAVSPAAASTLVVSAPTSATAGVPISVTVTAKDPYGNTATGYLGTVHFTSSDSSAVLPSNYTFTAADAGVHTFTNGVTLNTTGSQTVTATDTSTSSITGSATVPVTATATATATIWSSSATPTTPNSGPDSAVTLGVKFSSDISGYITGIRFYKSSANTGTHVADLWTSSGKLLATATFKSETGSGWQQVNFATPVAITAGTTYVASYHTNVGHYADDQNYFASQYNSGSFHVPANGGVYAYGAAGSFPTQVWNASNYWVDVVLSPGGSPSIATTATANQSVSVLTAIAPSSGSSSQLVSGGSIQPGGLAIPGHGSASATAKLEGKSLSAQWVPAVVGRLNPAAQSALVKPINRRFMTLGGSDIS